MKKDKKKKGSEEGEEWRREERSDVATLWEQGKNWHKI